MDLVSQNFLAGAAGLAVGIAFIRGLVRERSATVGNFWVDLIRALLWVLLPLALVGSLALIWQGVPLNLAPYTEVHTLEGGVQTIAQGPVAALEFIKNLGTNGGGFFNANGAHPYENPTPLVNFLALLAIAVLPASLTDHVRPHDRQAARGLGLAGGDGRALRRAVWRCAILPRPRPRRNSPTSMSLAGTWRGRKCVSASADSVLAAVVTSNGATGSYNSMLDSYQPVGVLVPLMNMLLGEVVFGGLGTGLYSMLMIALIAVFLGGLMVGRTPEYLGKKITAAEARLAVLYALLTTKVVLALTAVAIATARRPGRIGHQRRDRAASPKCSSPTPPAWPTMDRPWPASTPTACSTMRPPPSPCWSDDSAWPRSRWPWRGVSQPSDAGPPTVGTLPSDSATFGVLVLGTIVLVGALSFLPALALGPIVEAFHH